MRNLLMTHPQSFSEQGIGKAPKRWEKWVELGMDNVEKCSIVVSYYFINYKQVKKIFQCLLDTRS